MINDKLEKVFYGKVKRKANKTANIKTDLRSKASRVLARKPEVMVKITGFSKSAGGVKSNLEYITRNGKVELEDSKGGIYSGKESVKEFFNEWNDFDREGRRQNQRDTMKLVLSMPEGTDPDKLKNAARQFLKESFGANHEYAFALHTDDKHPHVHIAVKTLGFDERRLNPRKADIQHWRESFAEKLRDNGIEAEATPRVVRGVVKKSESQIIRHIETQLKAEEGKRKPRKSTVKESQRAQATAELKTRTNELKPWEKAIRKNQQEAKAVWLEAAGELDNQGTPEDKTLASRIRRYAEYGMPKPETAADTLKKQIKAEREKGIER
jgi:type IV secretory pathway VirD2 relaxase